MLREEHEHLTKVNAKSLIGRPYPVKSVKTNEIVGYKLIKRAYSLSENSGFVVFLTLYENEAALIISMEEYLKYKKDPEYLKELSPIKEEFTGGLLLASWVD